MRRLVCIDEKFAPWRGRILRGASLLALAAAFTVFAPGFHTAENDSHHEALTTLWPGTSANAKKRRRGSAASNDLGAIGKFSDGTTTNAGSASNAAMSASNSGTSNNGTTNNAANNDANSARNGDNRNERGGGDRRRDDDQGGGGSNGPPATLADTFKSLLSPGTPPAQAPSQPGTPAKAASAPDFKSGPKSSLGVPNPQAVAQAAKPVPKGPGGGVRQIPGTPWQGEIGGRNQSSSEILGVRLAPKAVEKLQGLGFVVPPQPKNSFEVVRLYTPPGMDVAQAQEMLRQELPKEKFETNKYYHTYRARSGSGNAYGVVEASSAPACTGNRCAPREMIRWSGEQLAACSSNISVGVLDTGIDEQHPALAHRFSGVFIPPGRAPAPKWHGTAVFALLAGNPKSGTPGLIPKAKLYHASVFFSDHTGEFATDTHVLLSALDWMDQQGVKIVNMSFAGPRDTLVEEAIAKLSAKGMIFIAAAGNEGPTAEPVYPAAYRQVIAVTAVKADRRIYPYANRGRHIDVAAPGVDIWSAVPEAREGFYTGTSFAAPFVTALVATLYNGTPTASKEKLLAQLDYDDLGIPGRDSTYGRGLVLAPRACAQAPAVAQTPAPAPNWGTTTIEKVRAPAAAPAQPSAPTISAGFR